MSDNCEKCGAQYLLENNRGHYWDCNSWRLGTVFMQSPLCRFRQLTAEVARLREVLVAVVSAARFAEEGDTPVVILDYAIYRKAAQAAGGET